MFRMLGPVRPRIPVLRLLAAALLLVPAGVLLVARCARDGSGRPVSPLASVSPSTTASPLTTVSPLTPVGPLTPGGSLATDVPDAGASIAGRVLTAAGEPVGGALVCLLSEGDPDAEDRVVHVPCQQDGSFFLGGLAAGRWIPCVIADGSVPHTQPALVLDEAQHLPGVRFLVASADVRPEPAARPDRLARAPARTEPRSDFSFTWPVPPAGIAKLETILGSETGIGVRAGETAVLDFVVPRRALVRGIAITGGETGGPVAGAVVHYRKDIGWALCHLCKQVAERPAEATTVTGVDGRFEWALPYGDDVALWAVAPDGTRSAEAKLALTAGTRFDVELVFPARR
jgi:hypothetical protein